MAQTLLGVDGGKHMTCLQPCGQFHELTVNFYYRRVFLVFFFSISI